MSTRNGKQFSELSSSEQFTTDLNLIAELLVPFPVGEYRVFMLHV